MQWYRGPSTNVLFIRIVKNVESIVRWAHCHPKRIRQVGLHAHSHNQESTCQRASVPACQRASASRIRPAGAYAGMLDPSII